MTPQRTYTVAQLAEHVRGSVRGDASLMITSVQTLEGASSSDVSFLAKASYVPALRATAAGCVVLRESDATQSPSAACIIVEDPYRSIVEIIALMYPPVRLPDGLRDVSSTIDPTAQIDATAAISPGCRIGAGCVVGAHTQLHPNVVLEQGTQIGSNTVLYANVTCYYDTIIGDQCIIHSGAVIGSDGFGFVERPDKSFIKIPQVGRVRIGNDVEIGANTTIDRAAIGETIIDDGVKLDNLVHIAHGVQIGAHTAIAAQTGVSGSTTLGQRNRLAGQVGVVGHIQITDDVVVFAQSGVGKSIATPGVYFGSPVKDHRTALRIEAAVRNLPDLVHELDTLRRDVDELKKAQSHE